MSVVEVLRMARQLVAAGWEKGAGHFSSMEGPCCSFGAILRAGHFLRSPYEPAKRALFEAIGVLHGHGRFDITTWNDLPETTLADVLAAFDKAIALAETRP